MDETKLNSVKAQLKRVAQKLVRRRHNFDEHDKDDLTQVGLTRWFETGEIAEAEKAMDNESQKLVRSQKRKPQPLDDNPEALQDADAPDPARCLEKLMEHHPHEVAMIVAAQIVSSKDPQVDMGNIIELVQKYVHEYTGYSPYMLKKQCELATKAIDIKSPEEALLIGTFVLVVGKFTWDAGTALVNGVSYVTTWYWNSSDTKPSEQETVLAQSTQEYPHAPDNLANEAGGNSSVKLA